MDRHYDYESIAVARASHDPFGLATEKTRVWNNRASVWLLRSVLKARNFDIIHLHSGIQWLPYYRMIYPGKKIVIHLHGTKIRGRWNEVDLSKADMILVSTKDLLDEAPDRVLWLPNPVDEDLIFKIYLLNIKKEKGWAFHVDRFAAVEAIEYAHENNLKLFIENRDAKPRKHESFLKAVSHFEYYLDVKRGFPGHKEEGEILQVMSLTGLEALALVLKVIDWKGDIHEGLPVEHRSESVAKLLNGFYEWGWK